MTRTTTPRQTQDPTPSSTQDRPRIRAQGRPQTQISRRRLRPPATPWPALLVLLILSCSSLSRAQQPLGIIMQAEPLYIPAIGLEVPLPEGCIASAASPNSTIRATIRPNEGEWFILIQSLGRSAGHANAAQLTDQILDRLRKQYGVVRTFEDPVTHERKEELLETRVRPIERIPNLLIADLPAERAYVSVPEFSGSAERYVGYTVIETTPTEYVIFELSSPMDQIGVAKATYEMVVASSVFTDANAEIAKRGKRIARGIEVLASIDIDTFEKVIALNESRWERLFIPDPTGLEEADIEIGYRKIHCWKGTRGELDPDRPPAAFDQNERDEGYLLKMDVRVLQQIGPGPEDREPVDTTAIYFQSLDGRSEAWRITMTRHSNFETPTFSEIGARHDASLKIHIEGPGTPATEIRPLFSTEGYISQISAFLMPQLLAAAGITGDYAFYAYRTVDQKVRMREDSLKRVEGRLGVFSLETVFRDEIPPQVTLLREDASIIRTSMPQGRIWEPTTPERLLKLWQSKGLPLD